MRSESKVDVVIIGAGFAGLQALHELRSEFSTVVLEAGDGVGGTWYWNRYPGARCDVESLDYCYTFSPELYKEWEWSERYATQPEIERYANWVADRFDLRRDIRFSERVVSASFDAASGTWRVETDSGNVFQAQFVIAATGCLSAPITPPFEGLDTFSGEVYHTATWPREGVDFSGKRVGVVGTGSSGIQAIPVIAREAGHLTVFQRTPNYSIPARQGKVDPEIVERRTRAESVRSYREAAATAPGGHPTRVFSLRDLDPTEARAELERRWAAGGLKELMFPFPDIGTDAEANRIHTEFLRSKIREIAADPSTAEALTPTDYPFGAKRPCVDTEYFETYNRDNVQLVDVSENRIAAITPKGVRLADGEEHELDAIVFATGFDAMTGALTRIDIRGRDGQSIEEEWSDGPATYLGLMIAGFPNLFTIMGPGSPSVLANMFLGMEHHICLAKRCMQDMRAKGHNTIEATAEAQAGWTEHIRELGDETLFGTAHSWYTGANLPGKKRTYMVYTGGWPRYLEECAAAMDAGYEGFAFDESRVELEAQGAT